MHYFPRDDAQRESWAEFVRGCGRKVRSPKPLSRICSLHFSDDCYLQRPKLTEEPQYKRTENDEAVLE